MLMQHDLFAWNAPPALLQKTAIVTAEKPAKIQHKPYTPPRSSCGEIYSQIIRDIDFISQRFVRLGSKAVGHSDVMEATAEELSEMFISIGATASLCSYRLEGMPWRLEVVKETSKDGKRIVEYLDTLRATFIEHQRTIISALKARTTKAFIKRSLSLCILALDAASDFHRVEYLAFAGIGQSNDPVGDAQDLCEQHELNDTIPLLTA